MSKRKIRTVRDPEVNDKRRRQKKRKSDPAEQDLYEGVTVSERMINLFNSRTCKAKKKRPEKFATNSFPSQ